ncbi:MAG TPA: 3-methyl-2-oxobutanoate hydroxymethyltransferase [Sedimentibacter sp.]|nr:3-methyl-2-oxobutanoate hydroxymethyltransferase [Sedimentibacter sp.]HOH69762.1 3-methyl-2-oxobutanoate hydroxymethyltransferase [Sedimentibacter sp.]HPW99439.1 3-methyl-2-oxobutanoate hydroxymethyltransferase [Sedimentibacter sp.]
MAKKKTILDLYKMKEKGEKAVWVTAYDSCFASYAEKAGMDMILVGDSMGMIVYGYQGTTPVTMDMCINHCQAVRRGAPNTYVIGDMPFGSYHESVEDSVHNAVRFIKEADVDAIKLEGGIAVEDKIKAIAQAGIVVFGHVGLTPQSSAAMGGFKAQGRTTESARAVINDALAVYKAGAKFVLLEGVPEEVCAFVHKILPIPVYGIGAGADTDGQVLVIGDALGMYEEFIPKFAKKYADIAGAATQGFAQYVKEVKEGTFPAPEHKYKISGDVSEFDRLFKEMEEEIRL